MKTIDASGGPTVVLTDAPYDLGGSWRQDGTILFSDSVKGLYRLTVGGKSPAVVVEARWLENWIFAPARHFFSTAATSFTSLAVTIPEMTGTWLTSLDGGQGKLLVSGVAADYASGFLLYVRGDVLMAQAIDPASGNLKGDSRMLVDHVLIGPGGVLFTVSENRLL